MSAAKPRYEILRTETARTDVEEIARFIAHDSVESALAILDRLEHSAENLAFLPERGRLVPELKQLGVLAYREIIVRPWRIIYWSRRSFARRNRCSRPDPFHKCDDTIRGHVFCSFLALVLRKELQARLEAAGSPLEWAEVMADLEALEDVEVASCLSMSRPRLEST